MDKRIKKVLKYYKGMINTDADAIGVQTKDIERLYKAFKEAVKQRDDLLATVTEECFHRCDDSAEVMGVADISKLTREVLNRTLLEKLSDAKKTID